MWKKYNLHMLLVEIHSVSASVKNDSVVPHEDKHRFIYDVTTPLLLLHTLPTMTECISSNCNPCKVFLPKWIPVRHLDTALRKDLHMWSAHRKEHWSAQSR